jgi:hypothetical protein
MSTLSNDVLNAVKKRLAEEERLRKEQEAWDNSPAGQYGKDFGARLGPWVLDLAADIAATQRIPTSAMHVTKRTVKKDDPTDWPCDHGSFEGTLYRFPDDTVDEGFKSTPYLHGCRCPPADSWGVVFGATSQQDGLLSYGILPDAHQFWFSLASIGEPGEAAHYFDRSPGHDQLSPGELVVQIASARDSGAKGHPCSLGGFTMDHVTNFYFPIRGAEALFGATLEGFFRGEPLIPQFTRRPPPAPPAPPPPAPRRHSR